jgi:hypothetical protein
MPQKMEVSERLQRAQQLRAQIPDGAITSADIDDAINQGRP